MASLTERIKQLRERVSRDIASSGQEGRQEVNRVQAERERARQEARQDARREFLEEQREEAAEEARQKRLEELRREQQSFGQRVAERLGRAQDRVQQIDERVPGSGGGGIDPVGERRRDDPDPIFGGGFGADDDVLDPLGSGDEVEAGNIQFLDSGEESDAPQRYF